MSDLVVVEKNMAMCDSRTLAEKFTKGKHAYVVDVIKKVIEKTDEIKGRRTRPLKFEPKFILKENVYRGQTFNYYLLNKSAFMLVVMRFKTDDAFEWQMKFTEAFQEMENVLLNQSNINWKNAREQSVVARKTETDTIKDFVEYAKNQGSNHAEYYYKHFTTATYKALELVQHDKPKIRDTLDVFELNQLVVAELIAQRKIKQLMDEGEHYKVIFSETKQAIENYAKTLLLFTEHKELESNK